MLPHLPWPQSSIRNYSICVVDHLKEKVPLSAETVSPIGLNLVLLTLGWLLRRGKDQDITDSGMQGNCGTLGQD
jgi:hypothetical protein